MGMKIGLDQTPARELYKLEAAGLLALAHECGYEGVMFSDPALKTDGDLRRRIREQAASWNMYVELGGGPIDIALSGKSPEDMLEDWKVCLDMAADTGAKVLLTSLGFWPWKTRGLEEPGKTLPEQLSGGIAMLGRVCRLAEPYGIDITIHTSFYTADEYLQIMTAVDSPRAGLCLDTANAFLVMEEPVTFATRVAPHVRSTHLKDSCIYLTENGIDWMGGMEAGTGSVDLETIVRILFQANPGINLSFEDHWGRTMIPAYDKSFMATLPPAPSETLSSLLSHLAVGRGKLDGGSIPSAAEAKKMDWPTLFKDRIQRNAAYLKLLRDRITAGEGTVNHG